MKDRDTFPRSVPRKPLTVAELEHRVALFQRDNEALRDAQRDQAELTARLNAAERDLAAALELVESAQIEDYCCCFEVEDPPCWHCRARALLAAHNEEADHATDM